MLDTTSEHRLVRLPRLLVQTLRPIEYVTKSQKERRLAPPTPRPAGLGFIRVTNTAPAVV